jgi:hypothetical protein
MNIKNQSGITLMGFAIVLGVVSFFFIILAKLFPAYSEYNSVKKGMEAMKSEPNAANYTAPDIWRSLDKKFYISYVQTPTSACLKLDRTAGASVTCAYEYRTGFIYNIDFVVKFSYTVKLG